MELKQIPFNTSYSITEDGLIYSIYNPIFPLKQSKTKDGYHYVSLNNKRYLVHRLVLLTFIPDHDPLRNEVNHIDGNKSNNTLSNLKWVTHKENINDPIRMAKFIKTKTGMKYKKHNIYQ